MAGNGFWADLSCRTMPVLNKDGDIAIAFSGSTEPDSSGNNGTTTKVNGMMLPDGRIEGDVTQIDNGKVTLYANTNGTGHNNIPTAGGDKSLSAIAREKLIGPANACKTSLSMLPRVGG